MRKTMMGQELVAGLQESLEHSRGARRLRATTLEVPEPARTWRRDEIVALRKSLFGVSQPVFAALLSVTASTVRAWEQGQKSPSGAARRLLEVAALAPEIFERLAGEGPTSPRTAYEPWAATHSHVADRPTTAGHRPKKSAAAGRKVRR